MPTLAEVGEFLLEVYSPSAVGGAAADVAAAADEVTRAGRRVCLLRSIFVPEDEICYYLLEAGTSDDVHDVASCAGLRFERIVEVRSNGHAPG